MAIDGVQLVSQWSVQCKCKILRHFNFNLFFIYKIKIYWIVVVYIYNFVSVKRTEGTNKFI